MWVSSRSPQQPESPPRESPSTKVPPPDPPPPDPVKLAKRKEYEVLQTQLEPIVRDTAAQLDASPLSADCPTLKALLLETYENYDHTMLEINRLGRELGLEPATAINRPTALDRNCPVASTPVPPPPAPAPRPQPEKPSPEKQLKSLIAKFTRAYEDRDLEKLRSLTRMSDARLVNVETMFRNYSTFKLSVDHITSEGPEAIAVLLIETAITTTGEAIDLPPIAKKLALRIPRQGEGWDKIVWN